MTYWERYLAQRTLRPTLIGSEPADGLGIVVTIPAHREPDIQSTIQSLMDCERPKCYVEVLILINQSKDSPTSWKAFHETQKRILDKFFDRQQIPEWMSIHVLMDLQLQPKKAGVGTARKILMDEAVRRLLYHQTSKNLNADLSANPQINNREKGIIIGLDADTVVDPNYFSAIEAEFQKDPKLTGANIHFEHRHEGLSAVEINAINQYESHLRYYIAAQRWACFPFAFQTIGSAMAVRCSTYIKLGGMNRRKAGEDFYFLQKFIETGNFKDITTTVVRPSGRTSDRVPFGTGKAVGEIIETNKEYDTYAFESFKDIKRLFDQIEKLFDLDEWRNLNLPQSVISYLQQESFGLHLEEIKANVSSKSAFEKRFFRWFNAFRLMKYLHFARDHFYPNIPVREAQKQLNKNLV